MSSITTSDNDFVRDRYWEIIRRRIFNFRGLFSGVIFENPEMSAVYREVGRIICSLWKRLITIFTNGIMHDGFELQRLSLIEYPDSEAGTLPWPWQQHDLDAASVRAFPQRGY